MLPGYLKASRMVMRDSYLAIRGMISPVMPDGLVDTKSVWVTGASAGASSYRRRGKGQTTYRIEVKAILGLLERDREVVRIHTAPEIFVFSELGGTLVGPRARRRVPTPFRSS
jgi:hypothetical protein